MQLNFQTYGRGYPLIILHGLFGSLDNWHAISSNLAVNFHVFAVDQRNHGHSPHDAEMSYELMALDLNELMQRQALDRAHLLGHSMGGKTAMTFALHFPEKVNQLIVVDISPRAYPPLHENIFRELMGLDLAAFKTRQQVEEALEPGIHGLAVRRFLLKNLVRDAAGAFQWRISIEALWRNYPRLNQELSGAGPFPGPTLFLRGERSDYISTADDALIAQWFPQSRVRTVAGAGHWVHTDAPTLFLKVVQDFLSPGLATAALRKLAG